MRSVATLPKKLAAVDGDDKPALLVLNDDLRDRSVSRVDAMLDSWFRIQFPDAGLWELAG